MRVEWWQQSNSKTYAALWERAEENGQQGQSPAWSNYKRSGKRRVNHQGKGGAKQTKTRSLATVAGEYKIAQFKWQCWRRKGGKPGLRARDWRLGLRLPNRMHVVWQCPLQHLPFTFLVFSSVESLFYCRDMRTSHWELLDCVNSCWRWQCGRLSVQGRWAKKAKKDGKGGWALHSSHKQRRSKEGEGLFVGGFFYFRRFLKFSCSLSRAAYVACSVYACVCVFVCVCY